MEKKITPVIILCGGYGSRLGEEGKKTPKALIKIGGKPIISHLIEFFKKKSFSEIYLATGYKHKEIKEYINKKNYKPNVKVIFTGLNTMTGGRVLRLKKHLKNFDKFLVTYGDGLANVNLNKLINYHKKKGGICTLTAVKPFSNFGELFLSKNNRVNRMSEKEKLTNRWINGGFFIFEKKIFDYIKNDDEVLEKKPLNKLSKKKKIFAFKHNGFWKCLDNNKDKLEFNEIIKKQKNIWIK